MTITPKKITRSDCPCCWAKVKSVLVHNQHCSGEWNEAVEYGCGFRQEYIPNFGRVETVRPCPHSQDGVYQNRKNQVLSALASFTWSKVPDVVLLERILGLAREGMNRSCEDCGQILREKDYRQFVEGGGAPPGSIPRCCNDCAEAEEDDPRFMTDEQLSKLPVVDLKKFLGEGDKEP